MLFYKYDLFSKTNENNTKFSPLNLALDFCKTGGEFSCLELFKMLTVHFLHTS